METNSTDKNPIQVADRIFQVLEILARDGQCGLTNLSNELQLNKTTVHRVLNSLIHMGYAKQDQGTAKYSLTCKIWEIANQLLNHIDIVDIARPHLKELMRKTEETVHLVQRDGANAVYIDKVESNMNAVRLVSKVGKSIPLYCSGVGKALLADMTDEKIQSIWAQSDLNPFTKHTILNFEQFMNQIRQIRKTGYAVDDEENEQGVRCVAVSIYDYNGSSKYALSISAPISRMCDARIRELAIDLMGAKQKIISEW